MRALKARSHPTRVVPEARDMKDVEIVFEHCRCHARGRMWVYIKTKARRKIRELQEILDNSFNSM